MGGIGASVLWSLGRGGVGGLLRRPLEGENDGITYTLWAMAMASDYNQAKKSFTT